MIPDSEDIPEAQARRLERVLAELEALLTQPQLAARLALAAGQDEWSALQVLGHITEMIPYWLAHCRTLIAAHQPPFFGRTLDAPERLAAVARGAAAQPDELLRQLQAEIHAAAAFIRALTPEQRGRKGLHNRRGEMTVAGVLETLVVRHAEEHLRQVQTLLARHNT